MEEETVTNPIATITNNSDVDVDVFDVFNDSGQDGALLTYTRLGTVKKGETQQLQTLHFASQLQAMYTGAIAALAGQYYYQFPVAVMAIVPLGTNKKTSYTITSSDKSGMEQSFLFQKYVVANGDSKLAKDFFTALSSSDQEATVDKYFAATKNFSTCTLASWTAVATWSGQFTSAWQGPYYLYSVPPKDSAQPPKLIATVSIAASASANSATLTMADSSQTTQLAMNGSGLQEANIGEGPISASLKPAWMNLVQTDTQNGSVTTRYLIGIGMTGTVNGITVYGTGEKRTLPDSPAKPGESAADRQRREQQQQQDFDRTFSKITTLAGLAVSMLTAYFFYKQLKSGHGQKSDRAADEAGKKPGASDKSVDDAVGEVDKQYTEQLDKSAPEQRATQQKVAEEMGPAVESLATQKKTDALENMVDAQVDKLTEVLETRPPTDALESTAERLSDAQSDIESGRLEDGTGKLQDVSESIKTEADKGTWKQYEADALAETQKAVDDGLDLTESIDKASEARDAATEADPNDIDLAPDEFDPPDSEPIEAEVA
jgi:hypothetical protein